MSHVDEKGEASVTWRKMINYKEWLFILTKRDERRQTLIKERRCFMYDGRNYILDSYLNTTNPFSLLKVKLDTAD
jgi:hypothetical protein